MQFRHEIGTGNIDEHSGGEGGNEGHRSLKDFRKAEDGKRAEDGEEGGNEVEKKGFGARKSGVKQKAEVADFLWNLVEGDRECRCDTHFGRDEETCSYRDAVYKIVNAVGNKYQMPDRMNGAVIRRKFFFAM